MNPKTNTRPVGATDRLLTTQRNGVTTLTMNRPRQLNGWTMEMMADLKAALAWAAGDEGTQALILTGNGRYYSAGAHLGKLNFGHPKSLHAAIVAHNRALFDAFLDFPKPILAAVNGPTLGAAATSATLCDGIIAAESATFSTPFAALHVPPEGCSSVLFERLMGPDNAQRMLGPEGWKPTAAEALQAGLVQWVVPQEALLEQAQRIAEGWIASGATRRYRGPGELEELKAVNARESVGVADAFLSAPFMMRQARFLWRKRKRGPAVMFLALRATRPLWSLLLR